MKLIETTATIDRKNRLCIPTEALKELSPTLGIKLRVLLSDDSDSLHAVWRALVSHGNPEDDEDTDGLLISDEMLDAAGFPPDELLEIACANQKIVITAKKPLPGADPIDRMPKELRQLCDDLGFDPDIVRQVIEEGEYFR